MPASQYRSARSPRGRSATLQRTAPTSPAGTTNRRYGGKREEKSKPGERRRLAQLLFSAVLLVLVVVCKVALPDVAEQYRGQILHLLGDDTDFVAVFSSVGQAVAPGGHVGEALNDAYVAVFGAQPLAVNATVVSPLPEQTDPLQRILGFSYADPVSGELTERFGYRTHPIDGETGFHYGIDLAAPEGTPIHSFAAGTVSVVAESAELGKYVIVTHENGFTSLYAHCSSISAAPQQQVKCDDVIAQVGQTGRATGAHLHFEVHQNDVYLNPIYYVVH